MTQREEIIELNKMQTVLFFIAESGRLLNGKEISKLTGFLNPRQHLINLANKKLIIKKYIPGKGPPSILTGLNPNPNTMHNVRRILGWRWNPMWKDEEGWKEIWDKWDAERKKK